MKSKGYNRLANIDALRGWAILGIISIHSTTIMKPYTELTAYSYPILHNIQSFMIQLMGAGRFGVHLFFIISGYILCYVYDQAKYSNRTFYLKRFFRLAPLYYLVLLICFLFNYNEPLEFGTNAIDLTPANFITHAFFVHGLFPDYIRSIYGVSWSLTPEVVFYIFFPLLQKLSNRNLFFVFIFSCITSIYTFQITSLVYGPLTQTTRIWAILSPLNNMIVFIFGMIVYKQPALFNSRYSGITALATFILFIITQFIYMLYNFDAFGHYFGNNKYFLLLLPIFPYLVYSESKLKKIFAENKFIISLGKVSYSAFFIHWAVVLFFINTNIQFYGTNALIIVLLLTYTISLFTYKYIEVPGIRIGNRFINRLNINS